MKRKANCTNGSVAVSPVGEYFNTPLREDLPEGWESLKLRDITERITKGSTPTSYGYVYQSEGIKFIKAENIDENGYVTSINDFIDEDTNEFLKRSILKVNDVLFSIAGTIGRVGIVRRVDLPANTNQALAIIRTVPGSIDTKYLYYYLKSSEVQKFASKLTVGVGRANLSLTNVSEIEIPIALPDQQKLIVAEIEKQFSRLAEAVAALKRIQANLKRYKASVLKAAVEGKLTEQWRKEHPDVEPASELLKRILVERRKKWEEDYVKKYVGAHGHAPKDDSWKKKYKEPTPPDTSNLPKLPEGWAWATIEQLAKNEPNAIKAGPFGSSLKKLSYVPKGFKIYGQEQVLRDDPYFGDYYIDKLLYEKLKSCAVQPGDILISLVGTIGRVLILPKDIEPGIINPRLVKLSLDNRTVNAKFIKAYIQSPHVKHLFSLSSHGGTMDILNLTILKEIPIPLPSLDEQNIIIEELERIFSIEQELELIIDANEKRAERLRQSILKKAFSGKLLSIESDEHRSEYLAEIVT